MKLFRRKKRKRNRKAKKVVQRKIYSGVREQQGRVALDDDMDENTN